MKKTKSGIDNYSKGQGKPSFNQNVIPSSGAKEAEAVKLAGIKNSACKDQMSGNVSKTG